MKAATSIHRLFAISAATLFCLFWAGLSSPALEHPGKAPLAYWRELKSPSYLWPADGAIYYSVDTPDGARAHLIVIDMTSGKWVLRPALNETTTPTSQTAESRQASAAVNGGFFNLSDGVSTSYVVIDGQETANPRANKALTENPKLAPYLEAIFNRSEIRFLEDSRARMRVQIAAHNDPLPKDTHLVHSLQAGPRLLPTVTDREEAFVRTDSDGKEVDAIGSKKPAARTAFGITPDGYAMLICVAAEGQDKESRGITLERLSELLKTLGCSEAINLDGGNSTTMFVRLQSPASGTTLPPGQVVVGKVPETRVKSVLLLQRANSK